MSHPIVCLESFTPEALAAANLTPQQLVQLKSFIEQAGGMEAAMAALDQLAQTREAA